MIQRDMQTLIQEGRLKAARIGRDVLVSLVTSVEAVDPTAFFSLAAPHYAGKRFFWFDPVARVTMVGLGHVLTSEPADAETRFAEVEREWRRIADDALVSEGAPAWAGPLFFGGFSFDPHARKTALWRNVPHTRFVVPVYMLTVADGQCWLTVNRLVPADGEVEEPAAIDPAHLGRAPRPERPGVRSIREEEIDPSGWMKAVEEAAAAIRGRRLEKVVLARELRLYADQPFDAASILERLYANHPNTYVFAFEFGEECLIGATPERLVKSSGKRLLTTCLAGSIARGRTEAEDAALGMELFNDRKNQHEHALAVRMVGETMRRFCVSVDVPDRPILYKLNNIQHLYTPVGGEAKEGVTILNVLEALHPTPALGGYPQRDAVEEIRRLERLDRGWYAAPIGWMNREMDGEFAAAIRSALLQGKEASLFAGCGIVGDSDPLSEYQETVLKFQPMLTAIRASGANGEGGNPHDA
jgi:menaquinone-specific isochorismate synthase